MDPITVILILFALTTALSLGAVYLKIPYPAAMTMAGVLVGLLIYFVHRLSPLSIRLDPNVFFTAVLPPLLYAAAWYTSWNGFRKNLRPILLLAIGAVVFTTVGIAAIAVLILPSFTWPMAFVLGAILSPPDAVAVTAVMERLRLPKRLSVILEGESLVNDASALVVLRFAIAAVLGTAFSLSAALVQFPLVAGGGVAVGVVVAFVFRQLHQRIEQPLIETAMTLLTPYVAYLAAEYVQASGVLAVVTCGLILSRYSSQLFSPATRLTAVALWNFLTFILNGLVFTLIGLQLPDILGTLQTGLGMAILEAGAICAALILLRILWVFAAATIPRLVPAIRRRDPLPPLRQLFLIGWIGMRGVVSLAAALALPEVLPNEMLFPGRDRILFVAFAVILVTLVGQSLTLPGLIKWLKIEPAGGDFCEESEARRRTMAAALDLLAKEPPSHASETLRSLYNHRMDHLADCREEPTGPDPERVLYRQTISVQRTILIDLRNKAQITEELLRKLERELDLEESHIPL